MKIRPVTEENLAKAVALVRASFPDSEYEAQLVQRLHEHGRSLHEWVCIHTNKVIAYVAFSNAYQGSEVCGLHLGPVAVKPEFQQQGVGSELLIYALAQAPIKGRTIFVLGDPGFYQRFGFTPCPLPSCPFDKNNAHFSSLGSTVTTPFTVGYEPEFMPPTPPRHHAKKRGGGHGKKCSSSTRR